MLMENNFLGLDDVNKTNVDINKDIDYHWYRQNSDGSCSHKPSHDRITKVDFNGQVIFDPESCDRRMDYNSVKFYNKFIGFYAVSPLHIIEEE